MGASWVKIRNETPYPISYVCSYQVSSTTVQGHGTLGPGQWVQVDQLALPSYIFLKQGHRTASECLTSHDLHWWYNGMFCRTFTIREKGSDQSELELFCDSEEETFTCPNYGKQEIDRLKMEKKKREEEERRQREQRERERQLQEQIESENMRLNERLVQTMDSLTRERNKIQKESCIRQFVTSNSRPLVAYSEVRFYRYERLLYMNFPAGE
ncbi:hypothetical protein XENTR_v10022816 [Xenopus tropicalis]|nr:hypothetical protein XENTR_v10022816 [Xenopus tropicalis]